MIERPDLRRTARAFAAWVPDSLWRPVFLHSHSTLRVVWRPLVGPLVAIVSFVCSIGRNDVRDSNPRTTKPLSTVRDRHPQINWNFSPERAAGAEHAALNAATFAAKTAWLSQPRAPQTPALIRRSYRAKLEQPKTA